MSKYLKLGILPNNLDEFEEEKKLLCGHSTHEFSELTGIDPTGVYVVPMDQYDGIEFTSNTIIQRVNTKFYEQQSKETIYRVDDSTMILVNISPVDCVKAVITTDEELASIMDAYLLKTSIIRPYDRMNSNVTNLIKDFSLDEIVNDLKNRGWTVES